MNKLPQEISLTIDKRIEKLNILNDSFRKAYLYNMRLGACCAHDHYAPIITDLQKKLAELEAANEWVRVEDRLPEIEGDYSIYRLKFKEQFIAKYLLSDKTFNVFGQMKGVTHWKPLPKAPTT